jgi:conjugative relaxase-like TrwC/TraI family protein
MLRVNQSISLAAAKTYYGSPDYYIRGMSTQELPGIWRGKGAERLGLSGAITPQAWDSLCENRNPKTGRRMTARTRTERSIGYDFTYSAPKTVSLLYAETRDAALLEAFRTSVSETMADIEADMKTRVRVGGLNGERTTSNAVWGEFVHLTGRPVDGVPDPHLHAHCFVHNITFDDVEEKFKAAQFRGLKQDAPYYQARFHSRLARRMQDLGLDVARTKTGWELAGLSRAVVEKFSRRTALIEKVAKEKGIRSDKQKDGLGAKIREKKRKNLTMDELRVAWRSRMDAAEQKDLALLACRVGTPPIAEDARDIELTTELALAHAFERKSVVPERLVLAEAINRAVGRTLPDAAEAAVRRRNLIWDERDGRKFVTTRQVLAEETRMLEFARQGRGTCPSLGNGPHRFKREFLNEGQRKAVQHVLASSDRIILVRGGAGTGKTTTLIEAVEAIEANGTKVFAFAPSAAASRGVLASEGFANAETVARLMVDARLQDRAANSVLLVDEAGLLGTRMTAELFDLADRINARVLLVGDVGQHASVERGSPLRLLETEAGLVPAHIREIQRQKGSYRDIVRALSAGRIDEGFNGLDKLGWIREVPDDLRYLQLADDYANLVASGKTALVISPSHAEIQRVTARIREELKKRKRPGREKRETVLHREERPFKVLRNANLTAGELADPVNFGPGDVVVFQQNGKGYVRGQRLTIGEGPLPLGQSARFNLYRAATLNIARGELLRVTQNGKTADGKHKLNNGQIVKVKDFSEQGDIVLENGWTIARDFGFLAHGYAVTSHSSQSRTVDRTLLSQSAESFTASSAEQFYVSVSRAREAVTVYTDDKKGLLDAVSRSDERLSATEFVSARDHRDRTLDIQRRQQEATRMTLQQQTPPRRPPEISHDR